MLIPIPPGDAFKKLAKTQKDYLLRTYKALFDLDTLSTKEWQKKYPEFGPEKCPHCDKELW